MVDAQEYPVPTLLIVSLNRWLHADRLQCGYTATPSSCGLHDDCLTVGSNKFLRLMLNVPSKYQACPHYAPYG
jgi:hypothetical protein